jgi:hypothetical protein
MPFAIAFHLQLARASQESENPALHFRKRDNFTNDNLLRHDKVQPDTQRNRQLEMKTLSIKLGKVLEAFKENEVLHP